MQLVDINKLNSFYILYKALSLYRTTHTLELANWRLEFEPIGMKWIKIKFDWSNLQFEILNLQCVF